MASHKFKIEINKNPGDPPEFPQQVVLTKCLWCSKWYLSDAGPDYSVPCPNCRLQQYEDDWEAIEKMVDPNGRFPGESLVWIVNWLRTNERIKPPIKTPKGWE